MKNFSNKLFYIFPFLLYVTCCTMVRYNVPIFVHTWPWLLLGCVVSVIIRSPFLVATPFYWLLVYMSVVFSNYVLGDKYFGDIALVANEFAIPFLACSITSYILKKHSTSDTRLFLITCFVIILITTICTEIINIEFPGSVRTTSAWEGDDSNHDLLIAYWRMGMSNYLLPHAIPVLTFPCLTGFFILKNTKSRYLFLIALLAILLLVYLGGSTAALLLTIISIAFAFIYRDKPVKPSRIIIIFIAFLPFVLFPEILSGILVSIANIFSMSETGSEYAQHLLDIKIYSESGSSDNASLRMELYSLSIQQFFQNLFIGTQKGVLGYHSAIFDRLGALGLLGGIPLSAFFISYFKYVSSMLDYRAKGVFLICYMIGIIMLVLKNMWNVEMLITMLCVLPIMVYYIEIKR